MKRFDSVYCSSQTLSENKMESKSNLSSSAQLNTSRQRLWGKHMELRLGSEPARRSKRHVNLLSFGKEKGTQIHANFSQTLTLKSLPLLAESLLELEKQMGLIIFAIMAKNAY